jgi:hypothetical protein
MEGGKSGRIYRERMFTKFGNKEGWCILNSFTNEKGGWCIFMFAVYEKAFLEWSQSVFACVVSEITRYKE